MLKHVSQPSPPSLFFCSRHAFPACLGTSVYEFGIPNQDVWYPLYDTGLVVAKGEDATTLPSPRCVPCLRVLENTLIRELRLACGSKNRRRAFARTDTAKRVVLAPGPRTPEPHCRNVYRVLAEWYQWSGRVWCVRWKAHHLSLALGVGLHHHALPDVGPGPSTGAGRTYCPRKKKSQPARKSERRERKKKTMLASKQAVGRTIMVEPPNC